MNENDGSTARGFDPDTAPDLSKDGWPEKFAKAPVRRGRPPKRRAESTPAPRQSARAKQPENDRRINATPPRLSAPVSSPSGGAET